MAHPTGDKIPDPTVRRLTAYMRKLEDMEARGEPRISSKDLAEHVKASDGMVRRDLAMFGQFGQPSKGYDVTSLHSALRVILGTQRRWPVVVVGAGRLSQALLGYPYFARRSFDLMAAFDIDPAKIGKEVAGKTIRSMGELEDVISESGVRLAIITVPPDAADDVARRLAAAGVQGILNFSSATLCPLADVHVVHVDISGYLEQLSFHVNEMRP